MYHLNTFEFRAPNLLMPHRKYTKRTEQESKALSTNTLNWKVTYDWSDCQLDGEPNVAHQLHVEEGSVGLAVAVWPLVKASLVLILVAFAVVAIFVPLVDSSHGWKVVIVRCVVHRFGFLHFFSIYNFLVDSDIFCVPCWVCRVSWRIIGQAN